MGSRGSAAGSGADALAAHLADLTSDDTISRYPDAANAVAYGLYDAPTAGAKVENAAAVIAWLRDPRLAAFVREHLPRCGERPAAAAGDRVRLACARRRVVDERLDLILVSPWFETVPYLKRPSAVLEILDCPADLELLCDTPAELDEKREELGIVRVALDEGIAL